MDLRTYLHTLNRDFTAEEVHGLEDPAQPSKWRIAAAVVIFVVGMGAALAMDSFRSATPQPPAWP